MVDVSTAEEAFVKKTRKKTRIVPAAVFTVVVGAAVIPQLAGCDNGRPGPQLGVAAMCYQQNRCLAVADIGFDMSIGVADSGFDGSNGG
jgi:hypothetical protein